MRARWRIYLCGWVQGLGFRPFTYRLARQFELTGWVQNSSRGVELEVQGEFFHLQQFVHLLKTQSPPLVQFHHWQEQAIPLIKGECQFIIRDSEKKGSVSSWLLPDLATCDECFKEVRDPNQRRYQYPFTNCTYCGPRYSIIKNLPYDRSTTSMAHFKLCQSCLKEYQDPGDRRFHAQPMACSQCGPQLQLWNSKAEVLAERAEALEGAVKALLQGQVVAIKSLGGFHLLVDASNGAAVNGLRESKGRGQKPFALLFSNLEQVKEVAVVSQIETQWLKGVYRPIVLLKKRRGNEYEQASPQQNYLGALLPYTPLHLLLMDQVKTPLVCTSGNLSNEPICTDEKQALKKLGGLAHVFLVHNRPIVRPVEDSVIQVIDEKPMLLRRGRGLAPKTWSLPSESARQPVIALGGDLKHAMGLWREQQAVLGTHVGDLVEVDSYHQMLNEVNDWEKFFHLKRIRWISDPHPHYQSHQWLNSSGKTFSTLQHHRAHVWGLWAEQKGPGRDWAVVWDGSGWAEDGSLWGGEFFSGNEQGDLKLWGHLFPLSLFGGDQSSKDSRKRDRALLRESFGESLWKLPVVEKLNLSPEELHLLRQSSGYRQTLSTSMGRVFDGVSALLGLHSQVMSFEGQAAMALQMAAEQSEDKDFYPWQWHLQGQTFVADWRPMVRRIVEQRQEAVDPQRIARRFHNSLVHLLINGWQHTQNQFERLLVSGGCFQNRFLLQLLIDACHKNSFSLVWPQLNPPNDGGLALGQLAWWSFKGSKEGLSSCV